MDEIVKRLSEIETQAVRIMEDSTLQKKEMEESIKEQLRLYDEKAQADTAAELARLQTTLEAQKEEELARLRSNTAKSLRAIETDYEKNHTRLAEEVVRKIIEG